MKIPIHHERQSFSDLIYDEDKICPHCGQSCVAEKINFRAESVWSLRILSHNKGAMTYLEVAEVKAKAGYPASKVKDACRHLSQNRFWGLVRQVGSREGCSLWCITQEGEDFIQGKIFIPQSIWIFNNQRIEPPQGETNGEAQWVGAIKRTTYQDRQEHWENSVGMIHSIPQFI